MKRLFYILLVFLCAACVGQKEEVFESDLEFMADKVLLSLYCSMVRMLQKRARCLILQVGQ